MKTACSRRREITSNPIIGFRIPLRLMFEFRVKRPIGHGNHEGRSQQAEYRGQARQNEQIAIGKDNRLAPDLAGHR